MLAYVTDEHVQQHLNDHDLNCWEVYLEEITGLLGCHSCVLSLKDLPHINDLTDITALIISRQSGSNLSPANVLCNGTAATHEVKAEFGSTVSKNGDCADPHVNRARDFLGRFRTTPTRHRS